MKLFFLRRVSIVFAFIGFAIGRFGDKYGAILDVPHHWIYGLTLVVFGFSYITNYLGIISFSFGIGLFSSDFWDFLNLQFWGIDEPHKWYFWSIK